MNESIYRLQVSWINLEAQNAFFVVTKTRSMGLWWLLLKHQARKSSIRASCEGHPRVTPDMKTARPREELVITEHPPRRRTITLITALFLCDNNRRTLRPGVLSVRGSGLGNGLAISPSIHSVSVLSRPWYLVSVLQMRVWHHCNFLSLKTLPARENIAPRPARPAASPSWRLNVINNPNFASNK